MHFQFAGTTKGEKDDTIKGRADGQCRSERLAMRPAQQLAFVVVLLPCLTAISRSREGHRVKDGAAD